MNYRLSDITLTIRQLKVISTWYLFFQDDCRQIQFGEQMDNKALSKKERRNVQDKLLSWTELCVLQLRPS